MEAILRLSSNCCVDFAIRTEILCYINLCRNTEINQNKSVVEFTESV